MNQQGAVYRFGDFQLDTGRRLLFRHEELISLAPKAFEILQLLIESDGRTVEKTELMQKVWQDSFVEDNNLTVNVTLIRKALDEKSGENKFIVTVPRRGYRFAAEVSTIISSEDKEVSESNATSEISGMPEMVPETVGILEPTSTSEPYPTPVKKTSLRKLWLVVPVSLLLILGSVFLYRSFALKNIESPAQIQSLAVLPFKPLAMTEQDAIFGAGIADALITKLSSIKRVTVRPTSAIIKYAAQNKDLMTIGQELKVDALLEGNIQRNGDKLRISVRMIRVSDDATLWANTFDAKESDVFALQDSISTQVVDSLALKLNEAEHQNITKHSTENPEAYKLYLNGIFQLNKRTLESAKRAVAYFEEATEKQPDYALAYSGLGDAYIMLGNQEALLGGLSPRENIPKAKSALTKALNLDESLAEAHASMAWVSMWETGNTSIAAQNLRHALELNPNSVNAHHYLGLLLMSQGDFDQALVEMRKAQSIDQFSLVVNVNIGTVLLRQRRYAEAEAQCRQTLELEPNFPRTHWVLGLVLEQQGRFDEAILSFQRAVDLTNGGPLAKASLAHSYAKAKNRPEAEKLLAELLSESSEKYVSPYPLATIYTALGDKDKALAYLNKAVEERQFSMFQLQIEQNFDELRADHRFQQIEERMKKPQGD